VDWVDSILNGNSSLEEVYHNMFEFGCCHLHTIVSSEEEGRHRDQPAPELALANH